MPTKTSLFVDTSGWAHLVDRHEALHQTVHTIYEDALSNQRQLVTTNYVLAELVPWLASRKWIPRPQVLAFVAALRVVPQVELIHIDAITDDEAWKLLQARQDKEWSLVDANSFVLMWRHGMMEALTTDQHFPQAGFTRLPGP